MSAPSQQAINREAVVRGSAIVPQGVSVERNIRDTIRDIAHYTENAGIDFGEVAAKIAKEVRGERERAVAEVLYGGLSS